MRVREGKEPSRRVLYGLEHELHLGICPTLSQRNWAFIPTQSLIGCGWAGRDLNLPGTEPSVGYRLLAPACGWPHGADPGVEGDLSGPQTTPTPAGFPEILVIALTCPCPEFCDTVIPSCNSGWDMTSLLWIVTCQKTVTEE